jgi:rfaE bifunctional protein kinase chain/domain
MIVAAHGSSLGAETHFYSICGNDEQKNFIYDQAKEYGIKCNIFEDSKRPTTLKKRYMADSKVLLKVSHLHQFSIDKSLQKNIYDSIKKNIRNFNVLIFSDFNYGCLPVSLVNKLQLLCQKHNVPVISDSQSSSQHGDILKFKNSTTITPTENEIRIALRDNESGFPKLCENLRLNGNFKDIFLKLGEEGLLINSQIKNMIFTDRINALNSSPVDVSGAGDSMLIIIALCTALDIDIWSTSLLASISAAVQVSRSGNIPIKPEEILTILQSSTS